METEKPNAPRSGHWANIRRPGERTSLSRSATRALDILELFGQAQKPLRAIEFARALNLGPSTTNQLLKTMVESAHLTFDARAKTYLPSPRLARFAAWMVKSYGASEQLQTLLAHIRTASGETVTLSTPNDVFMQIVDLAGSADDTETAVRGLRVSIFGSVIGTAYLSTLTRPEVIKLAARARVGAGDLAGLLKDVRHIRENGVGDGPNLSGHIWSIAAPLTSQSNSLPLVLGLAGPATRVRQHIEPLRALIRDAAAPPAG